MSVANFENGGFYYHAQIPMYCMMMLTSTYFMKWVLIKCFMMQSKAEKTSDALTQVLDNLPDGVLMFENHQLSYCNQKADNFYSVKLSTLNNPGDIKASQYLLTSKRCMHELKTE